MALWRIAASSRLQGRRASGGLFAAQNQWFLTARPPVLQWKQHLASCDPAREELEDRVGALGKVVEKSQSRDLHKVEAVKETVRQNRERSNEKRSSVVDNVLTTNSATQGLSRRREVGSNGRRTGDATAETTRLKYAENIYTPPQKKTCKLIEGQLSHACHQVLIPWYCLTAMSP